MQINVLGIATAVVTFMVIGLFHPLVIKCEYHFGTKCWVAFLFVGLLFLGASLLIQQDVLSIILGAIGCSCLWSILEIFEQKKRVQKGWFPMNPKRKDDYK